MYISEYLVHNATYIFCVKHFQSTYSIEFPYLYEALIDFCDVAEDFIFYIAEYLCSCNDYIFHSQCLSLMQFIHLKDGKLYSNKLMKIHHYCFIYFQEQVIGL